MSHVRYILGQQESTCDIYVKSGDVEGEKEKIHCTLFLHRRNVYWFHLHGEANPENTIRDQFTRFHYTRMIKNGYWWGVSKVI